MGSTRFQAGMHPLHVPEQGPTQLLPQIHSAQPGPQVVWEGRISQARRPAVMRAASTARCMPYRRYRNLSKQARSMPAEGWRGMRPTLCKPSCLACWPGELCDHSSCPLCGGMHEDEVHFLWDCPEWELVRATWLLWMRDDADEVP